MYKIAVLGERDSIYGFAAIGFDIYPVSAEDEAIKKLRSLVEGNYAIIYVTEALQAKIYNEIEKYRLDCSIAIIPIPGVAGNTGMGILNVKRTVEQAVGSDIIFHHKKSSWSIGYC